MKMEKYVGLLNYEIKFVSYFPIFVKILKVRMPKVSIPGDFIAME